MGLGCEAGLASLARTPSQRRREYIHVGLYAASMRHTLCEGVRTTSLPQP